MEETSMKIQYQDNGINQASRYKTMKDLRKTSVVCVLNCPGWLLSWLDNDTGCPPMAPYMALLQESRQLDGCSFE